MDGFPLDGRQRRRLRRELRSTDDASLCRRLVALLELDSGRSVAEVAELLGVTRQSVYNWVETYAGDQRLDALVDRTRSGRPRAWTEDVDELVEECLRWSPDSWGYQAVAWTVPLLASCLAEQCGVRFSETKIRERLHGLGYSWKRARYILEPDPEREKKKTDPPQNRVFSGPNGAVV